MVYGIVYKVTNAINGKCYIGQTIKTLKKRINEHKQNIKLNRYPIVILYKAIKKYGWDNFKWEVIKECDSREILNIMETFMIIVYKTHMSENGYNMTWGGDGINGYNHSDETKRKISCANKGNKFWLGKRHSDETKRKISMSKKGIKIYTEKMKEERSILYTGSNNPFYGKKHTIESKFKQRIINEKTYRIAFPDEHIEIIKGLKNFCFINSLNYNKMKSKRECSNFKILEVINA